MRVIDAFGVVLITYPPRTRLTDTCLKPLTVGAEGPASGGPDPNIYCAAANTAKGPLLLQSAPRFISHTVVLIR